MTKNVRTGVLWSAGLLLMLSVGATAGEGPGARRLLLTRIVDGGGSLLGVATSGRVLRLGPESRQAAPVDLAEPVLDACAAEDGGYWLLLENGEKRLVRVDARFRRVAALPVPPEIWRIAPAAGGLWLAPLPRPGSGDVPLYTLSPGGTLSEVTVLSPGSLGWRFDTTDEVATAMTFIDLASAGGRVVLAYRFFPMAMVWDTDGQRMISLAEVARRLGGHAAAPSPLVRCMVPARDEGFWILPWVTSRDPESGVTLADRLFEIGGTGAVRREVPLAGEALGMARRGEGVVLWMRGGSVLRVTAAGEMER